MTEKLIVDGNFKRYVYKGQITDYLINEYGKVYSLKTNKFLTDNSLDSNGRKYVCLTIDGKYIRRHIHIMVAETFIGEIPQGMTVDHKDEDKLNNFYKNLEIVSRRENTLRFIRKHKINLKYSDEFVRNLLVELKRGIYYKDIADKYEMSYEYLYLLSHGKIRSDLYEEYYPLPKSATNRVERRKILDEKYKIEELVDKNFSNRKIFEFLSLENNNANTKLVNKIRKSKNHPDPKFFDKEFIARVDTLIENGYNNDDIVLKLGLVFEDRLSYLFARRRKKLQISNNRTMNIPKEIQNDIYAYMKKGLSNGEIIAILGLEKDQYLINLFGRLRKNLKKELSSTTIES